MKDDYLWDGSGEPDPEIQHLEKILGRFRHTQPGLAIPARASIWDGLRAGAWFPRLATAAAMVLVAVGLWLAVRKPQPPQPVTAAWPVARIAGAPTIASQRIGETGRLGVGQWIETDASSRAVINVGGVGEVQVEPDTRLRLVEARSARRLALQRGTIHAMIWAPPGQFVVDTPSAMAVDLGCAYTLHVDKTGGGLLKVSFGWVAFKWGERESFIPEGAVCVTRSGSGPGTPYYEDASRAFCAALEKLDFEPGSVQDRAGALGVVLAHARQRDALSLWHLLAHEEGGQRERVYERLAVLVPPPEGVTREGILRGDQPMRDLWWNQLGLQDMAWWRQWERSWPDRTVTSDK